MKGYITKIGNYHYFAEVEKAPELNSFVIQGKVENVYFYTLDKAPTEQWFSKNYFSRKQKACQYTRQIKLTDDPRLETVEKYNFSGTIFNKITTVEIQWIWKN